MSDIDTTLLRAILGQLEAIREQLALPAEARSSVQVNTSTRGFDITCKAYSGSPIAPAGDAAVAEYLRVRQKIEDAMMGLAGTAA